MIGAPRCIAAAGLTACAALLSAQSGAASPQGQGSQVPVYGASVEVVRLHAAVLADGGPVTDLTAADFTVIDNGVEHQVALALTPVDSPIDVVLAFDQSESIRQAAPTVKRDARAFLDALSADDCALVLPFQHAVGPGVWGPSVAPALLDIIDLTSLEGGTSLHDALVVGLSEVQRWNIPDVLAPRVLTEYRQPTVEGGIGIDFGDPVEVAPELPAAPGFSRADLPFRVFPSSFGCGGAGADPDRRKALVLLSDGVDTTSVHTFGELLRLVYQTDAPVFPVVIGNPGAGSPDVSRDMQGAARLADRHMATLAEVSGGKLVRASGSASDLRDAYDEIVTILRGSYLLGYYPRRGTAAADFTARHHRVEVKVKRSGVDVFARTEYRRADGATQAARRALRRGAELIAAGDAGAALQQARVATAAELWEGHALAAAALWMDGRPREALVPLQRALWLAPGVAATHFLAWQLYYDLGEYDEAWREAVLAQLAGADMQEARRLLAQRAPEPPQLTALLAAPRVFVEGPRGDDPATYERLAALQRTLSRAVSRSPYLGLVRDPLAADYYLYVDAEDVDRRRPRALESRLELYNYTDRRLWRDDMDIADLEDPQQVAAAVARAMRALEGWLQEGR